MFCINSMGMLIGASISLLFFVFYSYLSIKTRKYDKENKIYIVFSFLSLANFIYNGSFFVIFNAKANYWLVNIFDRFTIIGAMFVVVLLLHFVKYFFSHKTEKDLFVIYIFNLIFTLLALFKTNIFLTDKVIKVKAGYFALARGPIYYIWILYLVSILLYCGSIIILKFFSNYRKNKGLPVIFLVISSWVWIITGIMSTFSSLNLISVTPLTWIGSILMVVAIAVLLVVKVTRLFVRIRELYLEVIHDSLTNVYSRRFFEISFDEIYAELERRDFDVFLVVMDVDNFKKVNDMYGHMVGDQVIVRVAKILKDSLRKSDIIARYGGDEFVILMKEKMEQFQMNIIINRIQIKFNSDIKELLGNDIGVTCSFGIAKFNKSVIKKGIDTKQIFQMADNLMYLSKSEGKNSINIASI